MVSRIDKYNTSKMSFKKKGIISFIIFGIIPGFIIISAYMSLILGEGLLLLLLSLSGLLALPFIYLRKLMGKQSHRNGKTLAVMGITSWAIVLLMLFGATDKTSETLSEHGTWFLSYFGKTKREKGNKIVKNLVSTLPGQQTINFDYENGSIYLKGTVSNNKIKLNTEFILDTGASLTTISSSLAAKMGIYTTNNSPKITVSTASGVVDYPLATLENISIGNKSLGPLTVVICDPCVEKRAGGLLGLNFTSHFKISINNKKGEIKFRKLSRWVDEKGEIEPFIKTGQLLADLNQKRLKITTSVTNISSVIMEGLIFKCTILNKNSKTLDTKRVKIDLLKPNETKNINIITAPKTDTDSFQFELMRGFWKH